MSNFLKICAFAFLLIVGSPPSFGVALGLVHLSIRIRP